MLSLASISIALLFIATRASAAPTERIQRSTSRTTAPSGCLTVGGDSGYSTINDALQVLGSSTADACIFISSGVYNEQLTIDYAGTLTIYGYTEYVESYKENTVTITNTESSEEAGNLDASSTVNVVSDGFSMYNINVANGYGQGAQAVALTANAENLGFYACQISGYQDTLYAKAATQYYANSLVLGADDFIFGDASAWFTNCDIECNGGGSITANSRSSTSDPAWYVFNSCNIKAASGFDETGDNYLGRPWRVDARVMYQYCTISNIINAAGWTTLAAGATPFFYEYDNTGAGSNTADREYETTADGPTAIADVLGSDYENWAVVNF